MRTARINGDPVVSGTENVPGMVDPVLFWAPSINPGNISFYTGDKLAGWRGDLLLATMTCDSVEEIRPRGGDELNRIEAGKNYGWILVTHGAHYNGDPVGAVPRTCRAWSTPCCSGRRRSIPATSSFYTGDKLAGWRGDLLLAAMSRSLVRISFDAAGKPTGQERLLTDLGQRLRDVRQGPDGLVYVLTDETAGALLKIEP